MTTSRRQFLAGALATACAGPAWLDLARAEATPKAAPQRITLAQLQSTPDVAANLAKAREVFAQAAREKAGWVMFPELFLTGSYAGPKYHQADVAPAFAQIQQWCREHHVIGLIGTGWDEDGKRWNQLRIVNPDGKLAGVYAKTCLTYGDAKDFSPGPISMMHAVGGLKIGTLICNDLWVTPGYTDGPNPHYSLQLAKDGAQVIFHAVGSGNDQRYRSYHESNPLLRAAEARCPIVIVNAYKGREVNATSGVVGTEFNYLTTLPRDREVVQTVEFTPATAR